jgi:DNA polymerase-3 subunit gamma/tau
MSYLVYARKYRPKSFEELIGQKGVKQTLQNAIRNQRVAQAYIFSGTRGVGKTTAARILAKALNCKEGPTPTPCNVCEICTEINEDRSMDVIEIDGASNTSVDDVRSLREGVQYKPIHCRTKVIIIDEIHMLSKSAFNALLKTLEEPPPNTVFIFATTEFHKVPATIVSRCQHFEFKRISHTEIFGQLRRIAGEEGITISDPGLNLITDAAEGSLRDAQSLLDQAVAFSGEQVKDEDLKEILGTINRDLMFQCSSAILEEQPDRIFTQVEKILDSGYDLRKFHEELIRHFRNLLLVRSVKNPEELLPHPADDIQRLREEASKAGAEDLLRYLLSLQQGEQGLKFSSHPRIYLEAMLIKLCHYRKLTPLKDLLKQVQELGGQGSRIQEQETRMPPKPRPAEPEPKPAPQIVPKAATAPEPSPSPLPPSEADIRPASEKETQSNEPRQADRPPESGNSTEADAVLKDPAVMNFMQTFKAQILSVEPKKGEKIATGKIKDLVD